MRARDGRLVYAPTDLVRFLASPYASFLERLALERPGAVRPDPPDATSRLLSARGAAHEQAVLARFVARHGPACVIARGPDAGARTREALAAGRPLIAQAALAHDDLEGYADLLVRGPGGWEVWDAKLARAPRPGDLVQLGAYALLLERATGARPARLGLALGDGSEVAWRTDDVAFHTAAVERALRAQMASFRPEEPPDPEPGADHGRWQGEAERFFARTDHLVQVAGIERTQIEALRRAGVHTLAALAARGPAPVPGIGARALERLCQQARLQAQARAAGTLPYEVLPPTPDDPLRGLARLPPRSPGDVVLDLEGFPLVEGGLEYLWGVVAEEDGAPRHRAWWAHDAEQERRAVLAFLAWATERRRRHPDLHIYHYAAYERTALQRLVGRHGAGEDLLDDLLRGDVLVDLYPVVHQGLRIGTSSYSIKHIERLYRGPREGSVADGGDSIAAYEAWLASGEPADPARSPRLEALRAYNEDDCQSTWGLLGWLRERQAEHGIAWVPLRAPEAEDDAPAPALSPANAAREALAEGMLAEARGAPGEGPVDGARAGDEETRRLTTLLAHLLQFHRREDKPSWWAHFARRAMSPDDLVADPDSIGRLVRMKRPETPLQRSTGVWYAFEPEQETRLVEGDDALLISGAVAGAVTLERFDGPGQVLLKLGASALRSLGGKAPSRGALIPSGPLTTEGLRAAIAEVAEAWHRERRLPPCLDTLLRRRAPRLVAGAALPTAAEMADPVAAAVRVARALDGTTLCVQGPPGTGKTFVGARMIAALLADGRDVGLTAHSHKAVHQLLLEVGRAVGPGFRALKAGDGGEPDLLARHPGIEVRGTSRQAAEAFAGGLIAGTPWLFAQPALRGRLHTLFVDEAGQVALANAVAVAPSARNLVLLGDQMQLSQPIQGTHPGESGTSALLHLLRDRATIPPEQGLFLPTTRRMHPEVCRVVSGLSYEDRLVPHRSTVRRVVRVPTPLPAGARVRREAGVVFVPVEHAGRREASPEEAAVVAALLAELEGRATTDLEGRPAGPLALEDVLVVAPYNLQVRHLRDVLPEGARVGTVDRFQGQEARVVIVSLCTSYGESGGRGLDFVLDRHRLNVALSRACSLALVVGDPRLVHAPCRSVPTLLRLNRLARLLAAPPPRD